MNFRELRRNMIVLVNTLDVIRQGREMALVKTSIQKTMMWTGTYMKFAKLGDNPYAEKDGKRETVDDIEPLFDATHATLVIQNAYISQIDLMRQYLGEQIQAIMDYMTNVDKLQAKEQNLSPEEIIHTNMCMFNIYTNLTEARMWLGMELGRIKKEGE